MDENKKNNNKQDENRDIEVVTGNGENLDISPVYDHIKIDKPDNNQKKDKKIVIPKSKK